MTDKLKPCKCGAIPTIKEGYDTLQVVCENCGEKGKLFVGDYYDEAFMMKTYGNVAIEDWNRRQTMSKKYEYIRLENIDKWSGWDIVEILPARTSDKVGMAVICKEAPKNNDVISEFNARLYAYKTDIYIKGEELMIIPMSDYNQILEEMKVMFNDR